MNEKTLETIFKLCCDVIIFKDNNLKFISSNILSFKFSSALKTENIINKTVYDIFQNEAAEIIHKNDIEVLNTKKPVKYILELNKDTIFEMTSSPVITEGVLTGILTIGRDITDKVKAKAQRDSFVATLTHDLKTPTIAQIRTIELLLSGAFGEISDMQKEMLHQTLNSCKYMHGMISYILSTYKFENGKTKLKTESFDFIDLVKECCFELESLNVEKNLEFITRFNIKNPVVEGDKAQLKRVVINMISNAISYAFQNTTVEIILEEENDEIIFNTINQSPYMSKDVLNSIFEKYVSDPSRIKFSKTGTGLGLYLSKQIIAAHGGKMLAQSDIDNKNKIGFKIPKCLRQNAVLQY